MRSFSELQKSTRGGLTIRKKFSHVMTTVIPDMDDSICDERYSLALDCFVFTNRKT